MTFRVCESSRGSQWTEEFETRMRKPIQSRTCVPEKNIVAKREHALHLRVLFGDEFHDEEPAEVAKKDGQVAERIPPTSAR